jgi:hypothetical protein
MGLGRSAYLMLRRIELETPIQILEKRMIQAQIKYLELMRRNFRAY